MTATHITIADLHNFDGEPRVLDTSLGHALGMAEARKIRQNLIEANRTELEGYAPLRMERIQTGGRPATAFYLNEPQALLVCMFARTPAAAGVRKQVIDVFMAYRRGALPPQEAPRGVEAFPALDGLLQVYDALAGAYSSAILAHDALEAAMSLGAPQSAILKGVGETAEFVEVRARSYAATLAARQSLSLDDLRLRERAMAELGKRGLLQLRERAALQYRIDKDRPRLTVTT